MFGDPLGHSTGGDVAGVGNVVRAKRNTFLPTVQARGDKFAQMRN